MKAFWGWLTDDKNHRALQLVLTLATAALAGGWTLYTNFAKSAAMPVQAPPAAQPALAAPPALPASATIDLLAQTRARLVARAGEIFYFEDDSGAFSVDHALLLQENKIATAAQATQFQEVLASDLRQCSENAASRHGLAEKLAARGECLQGKGYSANTQQYLRAKHGLAS